MEDIDLVAIFEGRDKVIYCDLFTLDRRKAFGIYNDGKRFLVETPRYL